MLAVTLALLAAACGGDDDGGANGQKYVALDGSPRSADTEGVLTEVAADFSSLRLDGKTYDVAKDLQCFATQDGSTLPLRQRVGSYVQVGLRGKKVVWLASIANVVRRPGDDPVVYYAGEAVALRGGELVFRDGTVLRVAPTLKLAAPPKRGVPVSATIDATRHVVIDVRAT